MDLCMQMYGELHILTSRLYINIGIVYEDNNDYKKAYEYFKKWAKVSEEILGPEHPKTLRAKGVLRETRYKRIAQELGEWDCERQEEEEDNHLESEDWEEEENPDAEHGFEESHYPTEGHLVINSDDEVNNGTNNNESNNVLEVDQILMDDDFSDDENNQVLMNGYFTEEDDRISINEEHTDSENLYDDNFEEYDEQYILHVDNGPVIEEFNIHLGDDDNDDNDIVELVSRDIDNRYASDSDHENWDSVRE